MTSTNELVTAVDQVQMGVSLELKGQSYWYTYLDDQVAAQIIDEATKEDWLIRYDGFEMEWVFVSPAEPQGDQHIDAVCILGATEDMATQTDNTVETSQGGWCCGIQYTGAFSASPGLWAIWASDTVFDEFSSSQGLGAGTADVVDDVENWRTDETSFTTTFSANRWLPQEERSVEYYTNEYRYTANDVVQVYTYKYNTDDLYRLEFV